MVRPVGFSPTTNRVKAGCSKCWSYGRVKLEPAEGNAPSPPHYECGDLLLN